MQPYPAAAVTWGKSIWFRMGMYDPYAIEGIALLGHELVHVAQYNEYGADLLDLLYPVSGVGSRNLFEVDAYNLQKEILKRGL
jgi:hypothetical protein